MDKGTKEIIKNIAIIVLVPTVIAGAYFGGKYIHKKYKEKKENKKKEEDEANAKKASDDASRSGVVDTKGMLDYTINIPFKLQQDLFLNGKFYDAILKVPYYFKNNVVEGDMIKVNIKVLPENLSKLNDIVKNLSNEITIVTV